MVCVCVWGCMFLCAFVCVCVCLCLYGYMFLCVRLCMSVPTCLCVRGCACECVCARARVCVCARACVRACACICVCVSVNRRSRMYEHITIKIHTARTHARLRQNSQTNPGASESERGPTSTSASRLTEYGTYAGGVCPMKRDFPFPYIVAYCGAWLVVHY